MYLHPKWLFTLVHSLHSLFYHIVSLLLLDIAEPWRIISLYVRFSSLNPFHVLVTLSSLLSCVKIWWKVSIHCVFLLIVRWNWWASTSSGFIKSWVAHRKVANTIIMPWLEIFTIALIIVVKIVSVPCDIVHLVHDLIDHVLIVSLLFSQHFHFIFKLFQNVCSIQITVLFELLIFLFKPFEDLFVFLDFNCKFIIHLQDHFVFLHYLIF